MATARKNRQRPAVPGLDIEASIAKVVAWLRDNALPEARAEDAPGSIWVRQHAACSKARQTGAGTPFVDECPPCAAATVLMELQQLHARQTPQVQFSVMLDGTSSEGTWRIGGDPPRSVVEDEDLFAEGIAETRAGIAKLLRVSPLLGQVSRFDRYLVELAEVHQARRHRSKVSARPRHTEYACLAAILIRAGFRAVVVGELLVDGYDDLRLSPAKRRERAGRRAAVHAKKILRQKLDPLALLHGMGVKEAPTSS